MQAIGRQPQRAPAGAPVHYERHRPEQTTLYRLVQQHAATFFEQAEAAAGADLPQFVKDEFKAFLECGRPGSRFPAPALRRLRRTRQQPAHYWHNLPTLFKRACARNFRESMTCLPAMWF